MESRRSEWEKDKEFTSEQVRELALNKYENIFTSGRLYNKDPKDAHTISLVGVAQKLPNDSKKTSESPSSKSTKGDPVYVRDLPPWMMEKLKLGVGHKFNDDKEYW